MTLDKRPIAWHENNLKNRGESLRKDLEYIKQLQAQAANSQREYNILQKQINLAKEMKLTEFDTEQAIMKKIGELL